MTPDLFTQKYALNFLVCATAWVNGLQILVTAQIQEKDQEMFWLKKKQMSLGNGAIFTLVKLDNSDEMVDFLICSVLLFFFLRKKDKGRISYMINFKSKGGLYILEGPSLQRSNNKSKYLIYSVLHKIIFLHEICGISS